MRQRKSEAVLDSARCLFLAQGFDRTTVDQIAAGAHVSKATVYSNFPDKVAVLSALLDRVAIESAAILASVVGPFDELDDVEAWLARTATSLGHGVLRPEVLQLRRLAITESVRFPEAVATYFERGPVSSLRLLTRALRGFHHQRLLVVPDPERAAAQFAYAAVGPLQDRALLAGEVVSSDTIRQFAEGAARDFFLAHQPN